MAKRPTASVETSMTSLRPGTGNGVGKAAFQSLAAGRPRAYMAFEPQAHTVPSAHTAKLV
jgi:hypothetical protein